MGSLIRSSQVLALVMLAACGGRSSAASTSPENQAMIRVENQGFADMVIYAVNGGQRIRLGTANGNHTESFPVPNYLIRTGGPLRFLADPIGGDRSPFTEEIMVQPGDMVTLTIPPR
jgi:hypothetical protein